MQYNWSIELEKQSLKSETVVLRITKAFVHNFAFICWVICLFNNSIIEEKSLFANFDVVLYSIFVYSNFRRLVWWVWLSDPYGNNIIINVNFLQRHKRASLTQTMWIAHVFAKRALVTLLRYRQWTPEFVYFNYKFILFSYLCVLHFRRYGKILNPKNL